MHLGRGGWHVWSRRACHHHHHWQWQRLGCQGECLSASRESPSRRRLGSRKPEVASEWVRHMPRLRPFHTLVQPISPASTALADARMDRMGGWWWCFPAMQRHSRRRGAGERRRSPQPRLWMRGAHAFEGLDMVYRGPDGWTLRVEREKKAGRCMPCALGRLVEKGTDRSLPAPRAGMEDTVESGLDPCWCLKRC